MRDAMGLVTGRRRFLMMIFDITKYFSLRLWNIAASQNIIAILWMGRNIYLMRFLWTMPRAERMTTPPGYNELFDLFGDQPPTISLSISVIAFSAPSSFQYEMLYHLLLP